MSQFSPVEEKKTLADFFTVPKDVYPVGRLDYDSEGLLILTNNKQINHRLLNPAFRHQREYWVQVDGAITEEAINQLSRGVTINVDGKIHKRNRLLHRFFNTNPTCHCVRHQSGLGNLYRHHGSKSFCRKAKTGRLEK